MLNSAILAILFSLALGMEVTRSKRQSPHNTQHLNPPIKIQPLPAAPTVKIPSISFRDVAGFVDQAVQAVTQRLDSVEPAIFNSGARLERDTPAWFMAASHKTKVVAKNISRIGLIAEEATRYISQSYRLTPEQISFGLPTIDVRGTLLGNECPVEVDFPCQPRKYRAYNAYCNNVQNPRWGNANTRYLRYLAADYAYGVSVPRQASNGDFLPSAREVSLVLHRDSDQPHRHVTALAAVWGEFTYHDISHTPQMAGYLGQRLKCCNINFNDFHPECYPIRLPENDPIYAKLQQRCQEYVRSGTAPRTGCTLGPREQINQVTSYLDASVIYGSSKEEVAELRAGQGGLLKVQRGPSGRGLLPADENIADCRQENAGNKKCFKAGDVRVNEHIGLATLHTLWLREHNRVARELAAINIHWNDEQLFQEARAIVAAQIQHITYNEFLPAMLGQAIVDKYGLMPQQSGFFTGYDININAGVANSVATSAMRFFVSMMPSIIEYYGPDGQKTGEQPIGDSFYAPFQLFERGRFDSILRGFVFNSAQNEDEFIADTMTNHLFHSPRSGAGLDLAAQIIQQGRDHGIAGYTHWRNFCGLSQVTSFEDLNDVMSEKVIDAFKRVYKDVTDIDLFTGGLAEIPNQGAMVGPTFGCLIGRQFHYLRRGDRYWYENDIPPSSFNKEQLYELRKSSLARVICDNGDDVEYIHPKPFLKHDPFLNAVMACQSDTIKSVKLKKWKQVSPNFVVPAEILQESITRAKRDLRRIHSKEWDLWQKKRVADPKSSAGSSFGFLRPKQQAVEISNASFILQFASARFINNLMSEGETNRRQTNLKDLEGGSSPPRSLDELMNVLPNIDVSDVMDIPQVFECDEQTLPCDHTTKFRTLTGWCNNLNNPGFGKSLRALNRLLRPRYDDGLMKPRSQSLSGPPLPSPRVISTSIHNDVSAPHVRYTLMVMQFGQFLDHDITFTPVNKGFGDSILDCRQCDSAQKVHPECLPITVPDNDPYYPSVNITNGQPLCIAFTRSMPGQLTLGYREQMNQVTAFVDASNVYGSDVCEGRELRTFQRGLLNMTRHPVRGKSLLPQSSENEECKAPSGYCFKAGDGRNSEQPGLTGIHTIFVREHNRIVSRLSEMNPHWSDELLYQHGRRIISAAMQHIAYNEFLPRILGWNAVGLYKLNLLPEGYFHEYDPHCDPTILNEFATAAFRFGHSLVKPSLKRMDPVYTDKNPSLKLRDTFFNPDALYEPGMIDELMRGFATVSMETLDHFISDEVTNHLFEDRNIPYSGLDLAALNLQRGRDHALAPYNDYRVICNLTRARTFQDLSREIAPPIIERLKRIYKEVDDIDLFSGGLAETPLHGGLVGPTFGCMVGIQFKSLRTCDRFWYENADPLIRFTEAQLAEIRKITLSKVVCSNCDSMDNIQRSIFDLPDPFLNPRVPCRTLPSINLELWKERVSCTVGQVTIDVGQAERISPCVMCTCTKEGPACQSLKVGNCFHLAGNYSPEDILNDHVCKVQCAFAFRAFPSVDVPSGNSLGFNR